MHRAIGVTQVKYIMLMLTCFALARHTMKEMNYFILYNLLFYRSISISY